MSEPRLVKPIEILLVEDNPGDADLAREALEGCKLHNRLHVVDDGEKAMAFLRRQGPYAEAPRPDLILLDLNLPRKDGREVLAEIKADDDSEAHTGGHPHHLAGRGRRPQELQPARQLLHHQAHGPGPVPARGQIHRGFLAEHRGAAAKWGQEMSELLRVLLVEDNPGDADLIGELLPRDGPASFEVRHAPRLATALQLAEQDASTSFSWTSDCPTAPDWTRSAPCGGRLPVSPLSC